MRQIGNIYLALLILSGATYEVATYNAAKIARRPGISAEVKLYKQTALG